MLQGPVRISKNNARRVRKILPFKNEMLNAYIKILHNSTIDLSGYLDNSVSVNSREKLMMEYKVFCERLLVNSIGLPGRIQPLPGVCHASVKILADLPDNP